MDNPEDTCIAYDNDDAGYEKGDNEEGRLAAAAVLVLQYGARTQFIVVPERSCKNMNRYVYKLVEFRAGHVHDSGQYYYGARGEGGHGRSAFNFHES